MLKPRQKTSFSHTGDATPWQQCLGKTVEQYGTVKAGRTVDSHCLIVGSIADGICSSYPLTVRKALFSLPVSLIAAAHDVGKITPDFQRKLNQAIQGKRSTFTNLEDRYQYHGGATYLALQEFGVPESIARAEGSHHAVLLIDNLKTISPDSEILGGKSWSQQRHLFIEHLEDYFKENFPRTISPLQAKVIGGITQQADWLGSGPAFDDPDTDWQSLINGVLHDTGYRPASLRSGMSFEEVFGFHPHDSQTKLIESVSGPGTYILEASMGSGKTEAALYASYKMLEAGQAAGVYFALPTCLTSEKIHERMDKFLAKVLADPDKEKSFLITGSARFPSGSELAPGSFWFSKYHHRIFAHFGVGTIDQALIAAMESKRSMATLSGLAGKVVIFDEVHSYDHYTRRILEKLVHGLRELHCTVIILSATLTKESRGHLLFDKELQAKLSDAYPLVTAYPAGSDLKETPVAITDSRTVAVKLVSPEGNSPEDEAIRHAERGEQVLWIENSVCDSQNLCRVLSARLAGTGIEVGLLHSRFMPAHRSCLESHWVSLYGPDGWEGRKKRGRILVGTQVLEQSLDIDSDFLITRLAPMDLLLQRFGRLWRHAGTPRPEGSAQEAWILVPYSASETGQKLPEDFSATFNVYYPYILLRTLERLEQIQTGKITLPEDIRGLIEDTYSDRTEPPETVLRKYKYEMLNGTKYHIGSQTMERQAAIDAATPNHTAARLSDPTMRILLLRRAVTDENRRQTVLQTFDGKEIVLPWDAGRKNRFASAPQIDREIFRIRAYYSAESTPETVMKAFHLKDYIWCDDNDEEAKILVATVDDEGKLRNLGTNAVNGQFTYRYGNDNGCFGLIRTGK